MHKTSNLEIFESALFMKLRVCKAWEPNSAVTVCSQPSKQVSAESYINNSYNKALAVASLRL